uniref:Uncharacterized protein n=1 Tax=Rhizophora mucronata TaxID=61149 RepID=A0A2P2PS60_RHIMU
MSSGRKWATPLYNRYNRASVPQLLLQLHFGLRQSL